MQYWCELIDWHCAGCGMVSLETQHIGHWWRQQRQVYQILECVYWPVH